MNGPVGRSNPEGGEFGVRPLAFGGDGASGEKRKLSRLLVSE